MILMKKILDKLKNSICVRRKIFNKVRIYIVTVPTPINRFKKPDLSVINNAIKTIANYLTKRPIMVESTVYPEYSETIVQKLYKK